MNRFEYQNLASAKLVSYDLETCDPYLKEDGPGWARGVGYVLGCAIAVKDFKTYVPLGESPKEKNVRWLRDLLGRASYKTGANLQYDMGWLSELDIYPGGVNLDVQFAEALLDDVMLDDFGKRRSYSLDSLAEYYLGEHKASSAIEKYNKEHWPYSKEPRENLWRMPEKLVAEYAVQDAALPLRIITSQWRELQREGLLDVFLMECKLLPILVQMRRRGLNVDSEKAQETRDEMLTAQHIMQDMLNNVVGAPINVNSGKDLASVFEANGVPYPTTAKGNPSFTAPFLKSCDAPIAKQVLELRQLIKARSTFVENAILGKMVNNKIYPSLHPLRTDEGGTISGRFSSSQPNSQQLPKRNAQWAPIIRGMFVPEAGHTHWASMDLSQIEYRLFAHFANDPDLIAAYADPHTDFHAAIVELVGGNIPRIACKTLNFGLLYGMGKTKLTAQLSGFFPDEANPNRRAAEVYATYQSEFPAASKLLKDCATEVSNPPHFIRTILGRKSRFKLWEANSFTRTKALPIGSARSQYGSNLRIADSYKAVNRLLQGSAADMMKKAMVDAHSSGLFEKMGYPHLTIHDELCFSYHRDLHQYFEELKGTVENAVPLRVPVVLGLETGPDWGHLTAQECQARS